MTNRPAARVFEYALLLLATLCACGQTPLQTPAARARQHLHGRHAHAEALDRARQQQAAMAALPRTANLSAAWTALGPAQVASTLYGNLTGRVTSLVLDPGDTTGNTLYLGSTGGGVWKSTNAAAASPTFAPLTDTLPVYSASSAQATVPSLSIGALAMANGVLLAGTGDPNDATDSYYGAGLLRSADAGLTWTLIQRTSDGAAGSRSFFGVGFAGLAFSSATPSVAVAALTQTFEGNARRRARQQRRHRPLLQLRCRHNVAHRDGDGRHAGRAGARLHRWLVRNRGRVEPAAAALLRGCRVPRLLPKRGRHHLDAAREPARRGPHARKLPHDFTQRSVPNLSRRAVAVQPATGDLFALTVDSSLHDTGLYQDTCAATGNSCASTTVLFGTKLNSTPLETTNTVIAQGDYNLALAAAPLGTDTVLYAGTIDLYRCTLAAGCSLRNTTNAQNGCLNRAGVFPAQHALAALGSLLYVGNDGGLYRSLDAVAETGAACSLSDASHFQNLNSSLGSLAEIDAFAQDPTLPGTLLAGLGALGSAGTGAASTPWPQLATGEGGNVAIDPATPRELVPGARRRRQHRALQQRLGLRARGLRRNHRPHAGFLRSSSHPRALAARPPRSPRTCSSAPAGPGADPCPEALSGLGRTRSPHPMQRPLRPPVRAPRPSCAHSPQEVQRARQARRRTPAPRYCTPEWPARRMAAERSADTSSPPPPRTSQATPQPGPTPQSPRSRTTSHLQTSSIQAASTSRRSPRTRTTQPAQPCTRPSWASPRTPPPRRTCTAPSTSARTG